MLPATTGSSAGRNVVIAPSAKIQAFGIDHLERRGLQQAERPRDRSALERSCPGDLVGEDRGGSRSRRPSSANATSGTVVTSAPRPAATARAIDPMPSAVPTTCRSVRRKPNSAPDAQSRMLFGPGVTELTNEKATSAPRDPWPGRYGGRGRRGLVRSCDGAADDRGLDPSLEAADPRASARCSTPGSRTTRYPPHTHDAWTLFIVDEGAIRYDLDRHARGAEPSMVSVLPPHVVHDGRPGHEPRLPEARPLPRDERPRRAPHRAGGRPARGPRSDAPSRRSPRSTTRSTVSTTPSRRRPGWRSSPSGSGRPSGDAARGAPAMPADDRRRAGPRLPRRPRVRAGDDGGCLATRARARARRSSHVPSPTPSGSRPTRTWSAGGSTRRGIGSSAGSR